ncbi:MAG: PilZ domain-containing protein [Pseudobdellovibrio sp.]|nr:PilZ domain-containing protein [Pseudobdellovibrio sp.]
MWALHNSLKGWTLYSLTEREVQLMINTLSSNEIKLVKVCKKSDREWHKLSREEFPELYAPAGKFEEGYPALSSEASAESTDTDYFVVKTKKVIHPRLHDRIEKQFTATVLGQTNNFDTTTIDLSEGGIQFNDIIPDWVSGYFIVRIADAGQIYQVMCSLVEDQKEKKRVQVMSEESDPQFLKYRNWLDSLRG